MGRKSGLRGVNTSRFQKHAAVKITKEIKEMAYAVADNTVVNVQLVVRDKLDEVYKANLKASYVARSPRGEQVYDTHLKKRSTYTNTNTLYDAVETIIDDKGYVRVTLKDMVYKDDDRDEPVTVEKVHKWLTEGTKGGGKKTGVYKDANGEWHYNYPTPKHDFEEHTVNEMKGFLASLRSDIAAGKYTTYRYTGKKKPRTHYRGEDLTQQR